MPSNRVIAPTMHEVIELLNEADDGPVVLTLDDRRYRLERQPPMTIEIDPDASIVSLRKGFGMLRGVDIEALKAEIYDARYDE